MALMINNNFQNLQLNNKIIKFTWKELLQLEDTLNKLEYKGTKLGGLFANFLYANFFFNPYTSDKRSIISQFIKLYLKTIFGRNNKRPLSKVDFIFNYTSNNPKLTGFFNPLLKYIQKTNILFISKPGHYFENDALINFYSPSPLSISEWKKWKREFKNVLLNFKELKDELHDKYKINNIQYLHLKFILICQTQNLFMFESVLQEVQPKAVLTDHDRQMLNSSLILAAKIKGVKTFTFIHGSADPEPDFIPLLADYMFCWGNKHFSQFVKVAIDEKRLLIVGNPRLERPKIIAAPVYGYERKLITLITNPIETTEKLLLAEKFIEAVTQLGKINTTIDAALKLHPSEDKNDYEYLKQKFPQLTIYSSKEISNVEIMNKSFLFVSHNSTMAFDALMHCKKVVIFNPAGITFPIGIGEELHKYAGCKLAKTTEELKEAINLEIKESETESDFSKAESYINNYCKYWGEESTRLIYNFISQNTSL